MQTQNRLLDDLARIAAGVVEGLSGMGQQAEARLREQVERLLGRMDLVRREEFEAVKAMAQRAREEQEVLTARLAELEARLAQSPTPSGPRPKRKAGSGTSAAETGGGR